ncbi:MAG: hypothetical protein OJF47_003495 [Nitrospira sp.]|nr:MAG: hypothetical protein OJF47_003495 [Nitrospira sp.]
MFRAGAFLKRIALRFLARKITYNLLSDKVDSPVRKK